MKKTKRDSFDPVPGSTGPSTRQAVIDKSRAMKEREEERQNKKYITNKARGIIRYEG